MTGIGQRIRQERTRLKLSQSALGVIGGVETNAQGNYESGARSPKSDYLSRITEAGVDIYFIFTGQRRVDLESLTSTNSPTINEHIGNVTNQLHRNLYGLIDALYQMTLLIEIRVSGTADENVKAELDIIREQAQALAQATVRLIFITSKLS